MLHFSSQKKKAGGKPPAPQELEDSYEKVLLPCKYEYIQFLLINHLKLLQKI